MTFLFTDIEKSTARWEQDRAVMADALAAHDELLLRVVQGHGGEVFKHTGDGICAVFASAQDAVGAATGAQQALGLPVRMGLHTGVAESRGGDYFGPVLNRTARIMGAGSGGQVLLSAATAALVEGVELSDLGEHRLRDLATPERLFQVGKQRFAPLVTLSMFRTNVREALSSFVGRAQELAELGELLAAHRMVTLTGVGGTGKTRLALRAAVAHRALFPDGVWVVELASLADAAAIPAALSSVLEVVPQPGQAVIDRVVEFLSDRRALLIIDNCEHVLDDAAALVQTLLGACANLVVLATSRESLAILGEHTFAVPTLSDVNGGLSDGVRLFVDRVREERPGFDLTAGNRSSVERICARLDDLPLGIELAAARAAAMGTSEIANRLDERFRLLTGGQRGRSARHKTLRATVEWSYTLLDADERAVFELLSVFAGTFDLDAVLAVCTLGGLDDYPIIDAVVSLVAKSMVVVDEHPTLGTRYRLLETLRAFGHERLEASGRLDAGQKRHAMHYMQRGHDAAIEVWRADSARSGQLLLADAANHRAAQAWLVANACTEDAMVHATNLLESSVWRGWREPADWLRATMSDSAVNTSIYRSHALAALAYYSAEVDYDLEQAEHLARGSIDSRREESLAAEPTTLGPEIAMWFVALSRGEWDDALRWASGQIERGARRQHVGDHILGFAEKSLAWSLLDRFDEAQTTAEEVERCLGPHPDPLPAWCLHFAQGTAWANDDPDRAMQCFESGSDAAMSGGLPFLAHITNRDAMAVRIGRLPTDQAAAAARDVIEGLWDARDVFNMRIAVAHTVVVCARAARFRDAALIDGWLGRDAVPMAPHYAARLENARHDIDAHLGDYASVLRSRGANWPPAAMVEFALTTLSSVAETTEPAHDAEASPGIAR